jgi:hypothetical protein
MQNTEIHSKEDAGIILKEFSEKTKGTGNLKK